MACALSKQCGCAVYTLLPNTLRARGQGGLTRGKNVPVHQQILLLSHAHVEDFEIRAAVALVSTILRLVE